jgi:hypothetical protein
MTSDRFVTAPAHAVGAICGELPTEVAEPDSIGG